jgi:hypothetical protein
MSQTESRRPEGRTRYRDTAETFFEQQWISIATGWLCDLPAADTATSIIGGGSA